MKLTDYLKDGKITDEGLKKLEELLEMEEKIENSYGYAYHCFSNRRTYYSKEVFNNDLLTEYSYCKKELDILKRSLKEVSKRIFIRPALKGLIAGFWD